MTDKEQDGSQDGSPLKTIQVRYPAYPGNPEYCTGITLNFTGKEFLISLIQVLPPMFGSRDDIPDEIEGKILYRAVVSPEHWLTAVNSFNDQITRLRKEGAPLPSVEGTE